MFIMCENGERSANQKNCVSIRFDDRTEMEFLLFYLLEHWWIISKYDLQKLSNSVKILNFVTFFNYFDVTGFSFDDEHHFWNILATGIIPLKIGVSSGQG